MSVRVEKSFVKDDKLRWRRGVTDGFEGFL